MLHFFDARRNRLRRVLDQVVVRRVESMPVEPHHGRLERLRYLRLITGGDHVPAADIDFIGQWPASPTWAHALP